MIGRYPFCWLMLEMVTSFSSEGTRSVNGQLNNILTGFFILVESSLSVVNSGAVTQNPTSTKLLLQYCHKILLHDLLKIRLREQYISHSHNRYAENIGR